MAAFGMGLLVASLMARFRDLKNVIPFVLQLGMFLSPVIYAAALVPEHLRWLLSCNPLTAAIESWRWCLFGADYPILWHEVGIASGMALLLLIIGRLWFAHEERRFADVL
jgi:lipopolysaccharide transport system permease protein